MCSVCVCAMFYVYLGELHHHPSPFDPNLIIRLLQININFNYFTFANLCFQQIKGTAMGAAFSPTIANIYMSSLINKFMLTQSTTPLILTRYIDDIFMIWNDSIDTLNTFLMKLNSFHPSLKFTHTYSHKTINFLDLTIYKGFNFYFTNVLDTSTYQKPLNLYQYLHYTSAHPQNVFKAIIRGECIRYARTNTTQEMFMSMIHTFKTRLYKRNYPKALVEKTVHTVKFEKRNQFLLHNQPTQLTCFPPLFKSIPPPQYKLLKEIILKDYNKLKFTSPRFVSLRLPSLRNILVRATVFPTDEQFLDIIYILNDTTPTDHVQSAKLPKLRYNSTVIKPCRHPKCSTCSHHLLNTTTFTDNNKSPTTYNIRHQFTCTSTNIIYLITCNKCKKQYVGHTTNQLNTRINHHRSNILNKKSIYISQHFNRPDHSISNLKVQPIDKGDTLQELLKLETFWIKTLRTRVPNGLNISPGTTQFT